MRKSGVLVLMLLAILSGAGRMSAEAAGPSITIHSEQGFDGKYKQESGTLLTVTMKNNGDAFSGAMLIQFSPGYGDQPSKLQKVELPAGSEKIYSVALPASSQKITLYEGDWRDGREVSYKETNKTGSSAIDPEKKVFGVMSENYDRLKQLRIMPSGTSEMLKIKQDRVPASAEGLALFDYILIDEYDVSALKKEQQEALAGWVSNGGILVAGGTPDARLRYGALYSLLPFMPERESSVQTDFLKLSEKTKLPSGELPVFTGRLSEGAAALARSGNLPVAAEKRHGRGTVIQTGFSLGDEPLASWPEYGAWFEELVNKSQAVPMAATNTSAFNDQLQYEVSEINELFPSAGFSVGGLILLAVLYLAAVVPVLYLILKKLDKREHAWWLVPAISIAASAVIFTIGARDRIGSPQVNGMGVYMQEGDNLYGIHAASLLSNTGGDYSLTFKKGTFQAVPAQTEQGMKNPLNLPVIEDKLKETAVHFPNVEYWSGRSVYGKAALKTEGAFDADLMLNKNSLTGTIVNRHPYDFEKVEIWSGGEQVNLGKLKAGESLAVNEDFRQAILTRPHLDMLYVDRYGGQELDELRQQTAGYSAAVFLEDTIMFHNQPVIAGYTKEDLLPVKIQGKKQRNRTNNLLIQPFAGKTILKGKVSLNAEDMGMSFDAVTGELFDSGDNSGTYWIGQGEYKYSLTIPEQVRKTFTAEKLTIRPKSKTVSYQILNVRSGKYENISKSGANWSAKTGKTGDYIDAGSRITLKIISPAEEDLRLPDVSAEGSINK